MIPYRRRPKIYNSVLQALLVGYVLAFVCFSAGMFITGNACVFPVYGSLAIYSLLSAVGLALLLRWQRIGLWAVLIVNAGIAIVLNTILPAVSIGTHERLYSIISLSVPVGLVLVITIPLFLLKCKDSDKVIWQLMEQGIDYKHFRHIYQLSALLIAGVAAVMALMRPNKDADLAVAELRTDTLETSLPKNISYSLLDSASVTLHDIAVIDGTIDSLPDDVQAVYSRRMFALRHILLSDLMSGKHNVENLVDICKIHAGDFSSQQQRILDWFLSLPQLGQEVWCDCPPVDNLSSFERVLKQKISNIEK